MTDNAKELVLSLVRKREDSGVALVGYLLCPFSKSLQPFFTLIPGSDSCVNISENEEKPSG